MDVCHPHNCNLDLTREKPYGIRVTMRSGDSLARVLGAEWEHTHWFATAAERDEALQDMAGEHLYSRRGDVPTLSFEPVERQSRRT